MAQVSKTTLKTYFNSGDKPTESNFDDLIDSLEGVGSAAGTDTSDFGREFIVASAAASARALLSAGTVGELIFTSITTASALDELGGSVVGQAIFQAANTAAAANTILETQAGVSAGVFSNPELTINAQGIITAVSAGGAAAGGKILQVKSAHKTAVQTINTTTLTAVTELSAAVVVANASNSVLLMMTLWKGDDSNDDFSGNFTRNGAAIGVAVSAGDRRTRSFGAGGASGATETQCVAHTFLDTPASAGTHVYGVEMASMAAAHDIFINQDRTDTDAVATYRCTSSLTVMEIDGT